MFRGELDTRITKQNDLCAAGRAEAKLGDQSQEQAERRIVRDTKRRRRETSEYWGAEAGAGERRKVLVVGAKGNMATKAVKDGTRAV